MKTDEFVAVSVTLLAMAAITVASFFSLYDLYQGQKHLNEIASGNEPLYELPEGFAHTLGNGISRVAISEVSMANFESEPKKSQIAVGCYYIDASLKPGWKPSTFMIDDEGRITKNFGKFFLRDEAREKLSSRCKDIGDT